MSSARRSLALLYTRIWVYLTLAPRSTIFILQVIAAAARSFIHSRVREGDPRVCCTLQLSFTPPPPLVHPHLELIFLLAWGGVAEVRAEWSRDGGVWAWRRRGGRGRGRVSMGGKASTAGGGGSVAAGGPSDSATRSRALSTSAGSADTEGGSGLGLLRSASQGGGGGGSASRDRTGDRGRARSLSSVPDTGANAPLTIPALLSRAAGGVSGGGAGSETDGSSPEEYLLDGPLTTLGLGRVITTHSLPAHLWSFNGFKCPICSKLVLPDDLECHLVICLTKPRISYNEDVLTEDKGECVICLEDLCQGDTIARLPCLCIYHKTCIDEWFQVNRSCPEHPYD
ncbi:E3 ubiquitin-protein ligase ZNRF1-like isoform X2 [Penaeus japonicus]|uniref:E3 ubiquitin-protein ligase ZNRF1-like isoform X2 n=1 Tax=Penaeus japonicus TaxID=27405 RepID=UPI001C70BD74|nr:E3 ubiquitin-protein ligase ZNRF1-like isoform X2 [Penaeus japonicus]